MKLFINNKIEFKAKIEISNVRYLSLIQSAIDDEIQRFKNHGWDKDPDMKAYYQGYLEIKDALNNTYEW